MDIQNMVKLTSDITLRGDMEQVLKEWEVDLMELEEEELKAVVGGDSINNDGVFNNIHIASGLLKILNKPKVDMHVDADA